MGNKKKNKCESKTLESSLETIGSSKNRALTSRCSDFINEIFNLTGVSPPLMDYVIFCHHDESCWPLSDSKTLKERFDAIFCTTLYNKALESIRTIRKNHTSSAQSIQPLIDQLKQTDTKAQQIMSRIAEIMREIDQKTELSRNIQAQNLALEHDIDDLTSKLLKITALQNQIDHLTSVNNQLLIETQNLRGSHEFGDLSNFDVDREMETKSRLLQDLEKSLKHNDEKICALIIAINGVQEKITNETIKIGLLEGRLNDLRARLSSLDVMTENNLNSKKLKLGRILQIVENKKAELGELYHQSIQTIDNQMNIIVNEASSLKSQLDSVNLNIKNLSSVFDLKTGIKNETILKIGDTESKIRNLLDDSMNEHKIESELSEKNDRLAELNSEDLNSYNSKISELEDLLKDKHNRISALQTELDTLNNKIVICRQNEHFKRLISQNDSKLIEIFTRCKKVAGMDVEDKISPYDTYLAISKLIKEKNTDYEARIVSLRRLISISENDRLKSLRILTEKIQLLESVNLELEKVPNLPDHDTNDLKDICEQLEKNSSKLIKYKALKHESSNMLHNIQNQHTCPVCLNDKMDENMVINRIDTKIQHYSQKIEKYNIKHKENLEIKDKHDHNFSAFQLYQELSKKRIDLASEIKDIKSQNMDYDQQIEENNQKLDEIMVRHQECGVCLMEIGMAEKIIADTNNHSQNIVEDVLETPRELETIISSLSSEIKNLKKLQEQDAKDCENYRNKMKSNDDLKLKISRELFELQNRLINCHSKKGLLDEFKTQKNSLSQSLLEINQSIRIVQEDIEKEKLKSLNFEKSLSKINDETRLLSESKSKTIAEFTPVDSAYENIIKEIRSIKNDGIKSKIRESNATIDSLKIEKSLIESQVEALQNEKREAAAQINETTKLINKLEIFKIYIRKTNEMEDNKKQIDNLNSEIAGYGHSDLKKLHNEKTNLLNDLKNRIYSIQGSLSELQKQGRSLEDDLNHPPFLNCRKSLLSKITEVKVLNMIANDLDEYYSAFDTAINKYHAEKIEEINNIIKSFWKIAYRSEDIDSIKIISEIDETTAKQRRSYNYRVVMVQQHAESDMRGRSSAGQKMIASIVIRLALFTAFCNDCSFIAFDEPTTNLDEQNLQGLAEAFRKLSCHKKLKNFQLILITHDETFLRYLCHDQDVGVYFETSKNKNGHSVITKKQISDLCI